MKTILLVGSSIFAQWSEAQAAAPSHKTINRAVGGTITSYWVEHLASVLKTESPNLVWFYCGSNDFNDEISKTEIVENITACREIVKQYSKDVAFAYFSIIKAPQKEGKYSEIDAVNKAVRSTLSADDLYIECNAVLFGTRTTQNYYVEDGLHLTAEAYAALSDIVKPFF